MFGWECYSSKFITLQTIYYTWKNIKKQYKLKNIAPTWNDNFELLNGSYSVSDIYNFNEYVIKGILMYI